MFNLLVILFISFGLLLAAYSILNVFKSLKFFRFPKLLLPIGLCFIGSTILSVGILFLYLGGILDEFGWIIFIYPSIVGPLSIYVVYIFGRKLHAS